MTTPRNDGFPPSPQGSGQPVPLWAPYYGATLPIAFSRFWRKYVTFSGRASRSEYWWWALIAFIISAVLQGIAAATGEGGTMMNMSGNHVGTAMGYSGVMGIIISLWGLATILPGLALTMRRLHDANFRGWWILLALFPVLGAIAVLVMTILPSNPAGQRFDRPNP